MIPASPSSRSTSPSPKRATRSGSKPAKASPERLALAEDSDPRQTRLKPLEAQTLVEAALVAHRAPPLLVVVGDVRAGRSSASSGSVRAQRREFVANDSAGNSERRLRTRVAVRPGFLLSLYQGRGRPVQGRGGEAGVGQRKREVARNLGSRSASGGACDSAAPRRGCDGPAPRLGHGASPADPRRSGFQRSAGRKGRRLPAGRPPDAPPGGRACEHRGADVARYRDDDLGCQHIADPGRRCSAAGRHRREACVAAEAELEAEAAGDRQDRRSSPADSRAACAARCRWRAPQATEASEAGEDASRPEGAETFRAAEGTPASGAPPASPTPEHPQHPEHPEHPAPPKPPGHEHSHAHGPPPGHVHHVPPGLAKREDHPKPRHSHGGEDEGHDQGSHGGEGHGSHGQGHGH